jgi:uncharacterized RDD family membrane protein YckC
VPDDNVPDHPGQPFGLPAEGPGSVTGWGRRIAALFMDWFACQAVVALLAAPLGWDGQVGRSLAPAIAVLFVEMSLLVGLLGASLGHRLLGIRVARLDGRRVGVPRAALRSLLLCLVLPAVVYDKDRRGIHDLAAGTIVLRT